MRTVLALIGVLCMALPASILTGLVECWCFKEGAGTVAEGDLGILDLTLSRSTPSGGAVSPAAAGWTNEPGVGGRTTYNGGGVNTTGIAALNLLGSVGDAMTLAVRIWPLGGQSQSGWPGPLGVCQYFGFGGIFTNDWSDSSGMIFRERGVTSPALVLEFSALDSTPTFIPGDWLYTKTAATFFVMTLERTSGSGGLDIVATLYINGTAKSSVTFDVTNMDLTRLSVGCPYASIASVSGAALWSKKLSGAEITALGTSIDELCQLLEGGDGLIGDDGKSLLSFAWPVTREDLVGVIETDGPQRHTRQVHERMPRLYRLPMPAGTPAEIALIADVLAESCGGALPTLWRHPQDDPPPPAAAVRYRIVNAIDAGVQLSRARGGRAVNVVLELQEV